MKRPLPLLVALLLPLGTARAAQTNVLQPDRLLAYKTVGEVALKLHVFEPEGLKASDRRAAIVFFFGGGWTGGDPKQFYPQARALADLGMVAFSVEYRVKSRNGTTPFECVKDGKSAIRWVREHAAELGVDPDRIVAAGGSAGGHVAACSGVIDGCEEAGDECVLVPFEGRGHGFFNGTFFRPKSDGIDYELTMKRSVEFLIAHGCLPAKR